MLYDEGYYARAQTILLGMDTNDLSAVKNRLEYEYRLARISHKLKDFGDAREKYQNVINQDSDQPFYYALNAILQLGLMAESEGDYEMAKKYYRQCLDMDKSQYRNSINYKAALGLERVGDYLNE